MVLFCKGIFNLKNEGTLSYHPLAWEKAPRARRYLKGEANTSDANPPVR